MIIAVTAPSAYRVLVERIDAPHVRGALARALGEKRAAHCEIELESDMLSGVALEGGRKIATFKIEGT